MYYVCNVLYAYGSARVVFEVSFCGLYCPNVIVFLACGGNWRCEHTLSYIKVFIHSRQSSGQVMMRLIHYPDMQCEPKGVHFDTGLSAALWSYT